MTLLIDTLAYTNRLRWLAPEQKLLFAIALLILAAVAHPPVQILIAIWISIWTVIYAKIPVKVYLKLIYIATLFWVTSLPALLINGIHIDDLHLIQSDAIIKFKISTYYLYISQHGIQQGMTIFTRAIASLTCLYFVMLTLPFTELLQTLRRYGFPAVLTEILLLMYRFIFMLLNTANEIWIAQQSRNGYRTFSMGIKSLSLLIGQLFHRTLENYRQISLSLASRGFNGEFPVWHSHRYYLSKRYAIEAIFGCLILLGIELRL